MGANEIAESVDLLFGRLNKFEGTSYYYNLEFLLADLYSKSDNYTKADSLYSSIAIKKPNRRLNYLANVRKNLIRNNLIKEYLSGSDYDKYHILKSLNKYDINYWSIPILITLTKQLDENYDYFIDDLNINIRVSNYESSYAVLKLSYGDIQDSLNSNYNYIWDNTAKVPYFINSSENRFISFDDTASVRLKTEYVIEKNLRGIMVWEITQDKLADGNQPLLEQINKTLKSNPTDIAGYNLIPNDYKLFNNYPNPFNPSTKIYNSLGQVIAVIVNEFLSGGIYEKEFKDGKLSSGIYFYSLIVDNKIITKKMMLLK